MENKLFSIKVRASKDGKHVSGSERIVPYRKIDETILHLCKRGEKKEPDQIVFKIQEIKEEITFIEKPLKIVELRFNSFQEANKKAVEILEKETGIPRKRIIELIELVHKGASPDGENMRGAMIVNQTGKRIELDSYRGIRTSYVDFLDRERAVEEAKKAGFTERTVDALALTTKNMFYKDMIAEYCISDEPDYTTGYVSTKDTYFRFIPLKERNNNKGGRIYFVKNKTDIQDFYRFLQKKPVIIKRFF